MPLQALCDFHADAQDLAAAVAAERERLHDADLRAKKRMEWALEQIRQILVQTPDDETQPVQVGTYEIKLRRAPQSVVWDEERVPLKEVPDRFVRWTELKVIEPKASLDKKEVLKALRKGEGLNGFSLRRSNQKVTIG